MKEITTRDLRETLTLLLPQKQDDREGGWREEWKTGPRLWASLWPVMGGNGLLKEDGVYYRIIIRAGLNLPAKIAFLWHLPQKSKRLLVVTQPLLIQYNRFLSMTAEEERNA